MNSAVDSPVAMARSSHGRRVSSLIFGGGKKSPKMKNRIQSFVVTRSSRRLKMHRRRRTKGKGSVKERHLFIGIEYGPSP